LNGKSKDFSLYFVMNKIKLNVLGISYSQTQSGAYALVLNEENGERRIPIIVGGFEAQSIAIQLEGLNPPRPLTHDLFLNFAHAFHIELNEVLIHKLEEGVFYAKLICNNGNSSITIDSRTSDAIALALRFKCPIYTTEDILSKAGIIIDIEKEEEEQVENIDTMEGDFPTEPSGFGDLTNLEDDELQKLLDDAIKDENYERASIIRDEMSRRQNN